MVTDKFREFVKLVSRCTTPEDEFEEQSPGEYESVDEMVADMPDERLCGEYNAFMELVRTARKLLEGEEAPVEEQRLAVVSNSLVSESTAQWMDRDIENIFSINYGWFLATSNFDQQKWPEDLQKALQFLRDKGFEYVMFDRDAETIEGLPTYDW